MRRVYLPVIIIIAVLVAGGVYYAIKNWRPSLSSGVSPIIENKIARQEIMADLIGKIADISPAKPVLGGNWYITRFWFIQGSDKDFYVEYEDGHIMRQILIKAEKKNGKLNYKVLAYFEPGENDWILKKGEDNFFGSLLDLYEHSEELGEWVKRN